MVKAAQYVGILTPFHSVTVIIFRSGWEIFVIHSILTKLCHCKLGGLLIIYIAVTCLALAREGRLANDRISTSVLHDCWYHLMLRSCHTERLYSSDFIGLPAA